MNPNQNPKQNQNPIDVRAQEIINILEEFNLSDRISLLVSLIFSEVIAHFPNDADTVIQSVVNSIPQHWQASKTILTANEHGLPN